MADSDNKGSLDRPYQILVVDDIPGAAETWAEMLIRETHLAVAATRDPHEAIRLTENNPIRVAVLDQKMPTPGTELFVELRKINSNISGIMLTAEADIGDAHEAVRLGFSDILPKQNLEQLSSAVSRLYYEQLAQTSSQEPHDPVELSSNRFRFANFGLFRAPRLFLLSWSVIDPDYVRQQDWKTYLQITAGQKLTRVVELSSEVSFELSQESKTSLSSSLGSKAIKGLETKLEASLAASSSERFIGKSTTVQRIEVTYELPQPATPTELHIQARNYQYAPVFQRLRLVLGENCSLCHQSSTRIATAIAYTGRFATQHEEILSDKTTRVIPTGNRL